MTRPAIPAMLLMVFEPDETLGTDPLDHADEPRRQGWAINMAQEDFVLVHREWGDQFEGGSRTHVWKGGMWEEADMDALIEHLDRNEL